MRMLFPGLFFLGLVFIGISTQRYTYINNEIVFHTQFFANPVFFLVGLALVAVGLLLMLRKL